MGNIVELLIYKLTHSQNPLLENLFGPAAFNLRYNQEENALIIKRIERKVYGESGLAGYEQLKVPATVRLARRAHAQFLCQTALNRDRLVILMRSFFSSIAFIPLLLYLLVKSLVDTTDQQKEYTDVVIFGHYESFRKVVEPLFDIEQSSYYTGNFVRLSRKELTFFIRILYVYPRLLMLPGLLTNLLRWLSYYGFVVYKYNPRLVVNFFESVCSSSLITLYLREQGIKHINQMHGERFPNASHAFCEFDQFNVWGDYFKEMFIRQMCPADSFVITGNPYHKFLFNRIRYSQQPRPKRILIIHNQLVMPNSFYYISLLKILKLLDPSWELYLRPHYNEITHGLTCLAALQADKELLQRNIKVKEESHIEVSLEDALAGSRVVLGAYSTAMLEAWIAGCKVVHLPGNIDRDVLMRRYGDSSNVICTDDNATIERFLSSLAVLNVHEDELVDAITKVMPDASIVN